MPTKIKIGIIGAGANTKLRHIPGLQAIEDVEVAAVSNRSIASAEKVAKEFSISEVYSHWNELIADPEIDAVVIGTWPYMHCPITLAALAAEKHVLTEARMAGSANEARQMLAASLARPHLVAQVVPAPFTLPFDRTIIKLISSGSIGVPLAVELRAGGSFIDPASPLHWRDDFTYSGFNTMTLGIWYESIMRWLGHCRCVTAQANTFVNSRKDDNGNNIAIRIPDHIDVIAQMECSAQLHMQISKVTGHAGKPELFIFGSKATIRLWDEKLYFGKSSDTELKEYSINPSDKDSWHVEQDFIESIQNGKPVTLTSFQDGLKYMEFTEAAIRSAQQGATIYLPIC